jgi:hypothetical protein
MKHSRGILLVGVLASSSIAAGAAWATDPHTGGSTGQPNQSCQAEPNTPGNAASAPGSAFNPSGVAGTQYAGQKPLPNGNTKNPNAVAQYDVACFQVSQP